ncbi:DNA endonuclease activator Ctp1 C-terminal domain-containing protein [[Candida] zeylanoides]
MTEPLDCLYEAVARQIQALKQENAALRAQLAEQEAHNQQQLARLNAARTQPTTLQPSVKLEPLAEPLLPPKLDEPDSEFARLPTQYSDHSNSPSRDFAFLSSPERPPHVISRDPELVADSDEEYDLLRPADAQTPLVDITNVGRSPKSVALTPLQRRDRQRRHLHHQLLHNPQFKVSLAQNPVYQQRWMVSDFAPNPHYVKPRLQRKRGKTNKEQQEIDRFYALAGPGAQLRSLKWDSSATGASATGAEAESQVWDRFPSPPGFNDVDFPSAHSAEQRRHHADRVQAERIASRLREAVAQQGYDAT